MANMHDEILNELRDYASGKAKLNSHTREYPSIVPIKEYTGEQIKYLREKNNFTQIYFGEILGVSIKTIQAWEAGTNKPSGTALRFLQILEQDPHALDQYILVHTS